LEHRHIIRVLDFGVHDTLPFLVMAYAPNGTLRQQHPMGSVLPLKLIVSYVKQVVAALQYAHDAQLIHRDIKPENLLLGRTHEVLLSDFGIALTAQDSGYARTPAFAGTVAYMAPEHINGQPRIASDQYSLGVVTYEWLCGSRPFQGTFVELCTQQMFAQPPSLRRDMLIISTAVEEVIMRALAKDPRQRFESVRAFAQALEQAAETPDEPARPLVLGMIGGTQPDVVAHPAATMPPNARNDPTLQMVVGLLTPPAQQPLKLTSPGPITPPPDISTPMTLPARRRISRRALLGGMGVIGLSIVGGGGWWWYEQQNRSGTSTGNRGGTHTGSTSGAGKLLLLYTGHAAYVTSVAWSSDGGRIASASGDATVQIWNPITDHTDTTFRGHYVDVTAATWSPDGLRVASSSIDASVLVWDVATGKQFFVIYHGHSAAVICVAWSPHGEYIASAGADKTVQVWHAASGNLLLKYHGHTNAVNHVTWSPDGQYIVSTSTDGTARVWKLSGQTIVTYTGHNRNVMGTAWSPDGQYIVSGGFDNAAHVWHATTGAPAFIYRGHTAPVNTVSWSPDSRRIASGSGDTTVQVWDATTGRNAFIYRGHSAYINSVAWSPNGQTIASGGSDSAVKVWQAQ
jgi:eukaryotic-like serine/threonine-protein kinase